jgi:butyryl-CoA dehydrogenase
MANPLVSDRNVEFLLYEVLRAEELCQLPHFADHGRETFDLYIASVRKLARESLFPAFKPMDEEPPRLRDGQVHVHRAMHELWPRLFGLGLASATRPVEAGGQQLPQTVALVAAHYAMAANGAALGYIGLSAGAGHLIEAFGDAKLKQEYMARLYSGEWGGTMALTEPHAGSSLADVRTRAKPTPEGHYLMEGNKVFISGGDQDITDNVVHLALARIEGAPAGIKGVSLFAVPKKRAGKNGELVDNDCTSAGVFHKMGWKGLPSIALNFGERGDCRGWLVGEPNKGIAQMFQMMNEARLMVGLNGVSTASAAYFESLEYARSRPQGRALTTRDPSTPQIDIIEHADVRRMLLRQKAIIEGGLSLLMTSARFADLSEHAPSEDERRRAQLLLDLLTPIAKTFPSEKGFEANALAVQIHGGYGYTSEYLPEAWLRDQKLNTIHEGTSGIQSLDLLGRKAVAEGGAALMALGQEVSATLERARAAGVDEAWCAALESAVQEVGALTMHLGQLGLGGDRDGMMLHSFDYLELASVVVIAWQWVHQAAAAKEGLQREGAHGPSADFYRGKLSAAQYWLRTELPRVQHLAELCRSGEDSYAKVRPEWL